MVDITTVMLSLILHSHSLSSMFVGNVTQMKYEIFSETMSRDNNSCHCSDHTCRKLNCHDSYIKRILCFVGPPKQLLTEWDGQEKCNFLVAPHPKFEKQVTLKKHSEKFDCILHVMLASYFLVFIWIAGRLPPGVLICEMTAHRLYPRISLSFHTHNCTSLLYL